MSGAQTASPIQKNWGGRYDFQGFGASGIATRLPMTHS